MPVHIVTDTDWVEPRINTKGEYISGETTWGETTKSNKSSRRVYKISRALKKTILHLGDPSTEKITLA